MSKNEQFEALMNVAKKDIILLQEEVNSLQSELDSTAGTEAKLKTLKEQWFAKENILRTLATRNSLECRNKIKQLRVKLQKNIKHSKRSTIKEPIFLSCTSPGYFLQDILVEVRKRRNFFNRWLSCSQYAQSEEVMLLQTKIFNLMSDIQALIRKIHSVSKMCHEISILKISINEAGKFLQSQHNLVRSCYEKVYPLWDALANFSQDSSQKNENNNSTNSQNALNSEYIQEATLKICQDIPTSDPTIQTAQSSTNTSMKRRPTARKGTRTLKTNSVFHYTIRHVARNKIKEGPDFLQYNVVKDQYNNGSITEETSLDDANNCSTVDSDLEVISKEYQIASPISALDIDVCANTHSTENDCSYEEGNHIPQTSNVEDEIQHAGSMLHSVNENTQCIIDYQRESVREYLNFNGESSCHTGTTIAAKKLANAHKKLKCICHNSEGETFCANQIAHRNTKSLFTLSVEYGYNHSTDNCLSRPNDQKDKSTGNNQKANWEQCMLMCNIPSNDDITDSMWIYKNKSELPSK